MDFWGRVWLIASAILTTEMPARASVTASAVVQFSVNRIAVMSVSGNPENLKINTPPAGNAPSHCDNNATYYNVTTNTSGQKISASIDADMPKGTALTVSLRAPVGAVSLGTKALKTEPQTLVIGVGNIAQQRLRITYGFDITSKAPSSLSQSRIVTYTIGP